MYGTAFGYFLRQFLLLFSQEVCEYLLQLIFGNLVSTRCMEYQGEGCILKKRGSFAWSMKSTWFLMMVKEFVGGCGGGGGGGGVHGELKGLKCEEQSFQRRGL